MSLFPTRHHTRLQHDLSPEFPLSHTHTHSFSLSLSELTMSSGVGVDDSCLTAYDELKLKHLHKFIIYALSPDNKKIIVEQTAPASSSYDDFLNALPQDDCRYAVYDFEYTKDGGQRNKICFVAWSPDSAKIKHKMLYASSKDAIRKALVGLAVEIQGTDHSEVAYDAVLEKVTRTSN